MFQLILSCVQVVMEQSTVTTDIKIPSLGNNSHGRFNDDLAINLQMKDYFSDALEMLGNHLESFKFSCQLLRYLS